MENKGKLILIVIIYQFDLKLNKSEVFYLKFPHLTLALLVSNVLRTFIGLQKISVSNRLSDVQPSYKIDAY